MNLATTKTILRLPLDYPRSRQAVRRNRGAGRRGASGHGAGGHGAGGHGGATSTRTLQLVLRTDAMLIDSARHLASLAIACDTAGYDVTLICSRMRLSHLGRKRFGRDFLAAPNVRWAASASPVHEGPSWSDQPMPESRRICIGRDVVDGAVVMPYPRYPVQDQINGDLDKLRGQTRTMSVFFAGNTKASYARSRFEGYDGLLNRLEVIEVAQSIASRRLTVQHLADQPIEPEQWLSRVAQSDFFLCPPGSSQPICHNLLEAMSVGSIPILQYGPLVDAALDGNDIALGFHDADSLRVAIDRAIHMDQNEIATRRHRICELFDTRLDYRDAVGRQLASRSDDPIMLKVHHENLYGEPTKVLTSQPKIAS